MANSKAQIKSAQKRCDLSITLCHAYTHILCEYNALYLYMYLLHVYFSLVNESLTCHPQCDSVTSCWGPSNTQCEGCRNFRYLRRCVRDCSVVSLPANTRWGSCESEVVDCLQYVRFGWYPSTSWWKNTFRSLSQCVSSSDHCPSVLAVQIIVPVY